jgi:hypothetical protein
VIDPGGLRPEELELAKREIEELQKQFDATFAPKNLDDLNQLETKLNEALAEIKIQRGNLQKEKGK